MSVTDVVAGKYRIVRRLAAGGMGEVCLAAQEGPAGYQRLVALKRILPRLVADTEALDLFLDEARLVAQLNHRNICQIIELGEDAGSYFVAMEFVKGSSVHSLLAKLRQEKQTLAPYYAVEIAAQVAEALAYAYSATGSSGEPLHIIHRDVTPHNILLSTSGDVKLIDFGVAKSSQQEHSTQSGMVKGKLGYLSPEQSRGQPLDGRSDLFSLGILLYEMVSGTNPFARAQPYAQLRAIQSEEVPPLASHHAAWAPLDAILPRLLAKSPADRFADASEAAEELLELRQQLPRPPQRLGPFVSQRFGEEISDLAAAITDSKIRAALAPTDPKLRAAPPSKTPPKGIPVRPHPIPAPAASSEEEAFDPDVTLRKAPAKLSVVPPPPAPAELEAVIEVEAEPTLMKVPVVVEDLENATQRLRAPTAARRPTPAAGPGPGRWMALGVLGTAVMVGAWCVAAGVIH